MNWDKKYIKIIPFPQIESGKITGLKIDLEIKRGNTIKDLTYYIY